MQKKLGNRLVGTVWEYDKAIRWRIKDDGAELVWNKFIGHPNIKFLSYEKYSGSSLFTAEGSDPDNWYQVYEFNHYRDAIRQD